MKKQVQLQQKNKKSAKRLEERRLALLNIFEEEARLNGFSTIAGIDEAGRGPLAGSVFAAACVIPKGVFFYGINDSKQLTAIERKALYEEIVSNSSVVYAVASVTPDVIDRINIYQATIVAMLQAVKELITQPDYLLVDGLNLPHPNIPARKIIEGDCLSQSIAAASILAKVSRDMIMEEFDKKWPEYGFSRNKGYGTPEHLEAIKKFGPCPIHRKSFEPIKQLFSARQLEFSGY